MRFNLQVFVTFIFMVSVVWVPFKIPAQATNFYNRVELVSLNVREKQDPLENQKQPLRQALLGLEERFQINLSFNDEYVQGESVDKKKTVGNDVEKILSEILSPFQLIYVKLDQKHYVIKSSRPNVEKAISKLDRKRFKILPDRILNPQKTIDTTIPALRKGGDHIVSGKVTDRAGEPIPGVNVIIKGSTQGVITDSDGSYVMVVDDKQATLIFSFVGYETIEMPVNGRSAIDVVLFENLQTLNEVIVTALGVERSTKSLGYAVSNVKGEEIGETAESNVINALSGRVAGLDISSSSGGVGASSRIILRGVKTIGANSDQPLFVIDGVPVNNSLRATGRIDYGNSIADFNPDDIEEITVLKSAAAAALYGSAGANGVIVIKTKSGKGNKNLGFEFNSSLTLSEPFRLIDYQNEYGPGLPGVDWNYYDPVGGTGNSWGDPFGVQETAVQWNSPLDAEGNPVPLPLRAYPDNGKDFFDTGVMRELSLAASKGEEGKYHFRLALRNAEEQGMVPTSELTRNTITLNAGVNITEKLETNVNLIYANQESPNRVATDNWSNNPIRQALIVPRHVDVKALRNYEHLLANGVPVPFEVTGQDPQVIVPGWTAADGDFFPNPFFTLNNEKNEYSNERIFASAHIKYKWTDWLQLDAKVNQEVIDEKIEQKRNEGVRLWTGSFFGYAGSYYRDVFQRKNTFANVILTGNNRIGAFGFNAILGAETRTFVLDGAWQRALELELPNLFTINNAVGDPQLDQYYSESKINSVFGNVDFDYKNLVFFTLTGRNDWNSTLPISNNSFFYPSASLSFIMSDLLDLPSAISFLKFRGNAGRVGIGTSAYQIDPTLSTNTRLGDVFEATIANGLNNPTLKPTRTTTYEVGMDLRLFDARLNFDVALYTGKSEDQIQRVLLPGSSGYTSRIINAGDIKNEGIEIAVTAIPVDKAIRWDVGFTYARNVNEVLSLAEGVDELQITAKYSNIRTVARPGEPYGQLVGNGLKRDPNGNVIHNNGLAVQTDQQVVLGNVTPDWLGSFMSTVSYKGLSLTAQVNAKFGGDIFSLTNQWAASAGLTKSTLSPHRNQSIVGEGVMEVINGDEVSYVPNNVAVPYRDYVGNLMRWGLHEPVVYDGTYIKLKAIQIYYSIPQKLVDRWLPFQRMRVGVAGRNLALLYAKAPNFDPEASMSARNTDLGFDMFNLPTARTVTFNLSFRF